MLNKRIHFTLRADVICQGDGRTSECCRIRLKICGELITQKQRKNHPACLEEDDLFILKYRLPTEAIDVEFLRSTKVFHTKGHEADALVHGLRFSFCKRKKRHRSEAC